MYEALLSQLLKVRCVPNLGDKTRENLKILRSTSLSQGSRAAAHTALEDDDDLNSLIANMFTQVEDCDMAHYWRDFLSMTDALMQKVHAVHICNWDEFVSSLRAMLPWLTAYDNNQYGRWLPDFWAMQHLFLLIRLPFFVLTLLSPLQVTPTQTWRGTCGLSAR